MEVKSKGIWQMLREIKIGSLFAGIGGFELGLERGIPNSKTVWQVEQDKYCQTILKKHWPQAQLFDDVCTVGAHNLEPVDVICGGFPCQDISVAGKGKGINAERSGLWWEMYRVIGELRPTIAVLENVPAITTRGGTQVIGALAQIGYDCEWQIISARMFGAPHIRKRWFCVAYSTSERGHNGRCRPHQIEPQQRHQSKVLHQAGEMCSTQLDWSCQDRHVAHTISERAQISIEGEHTSKQMSGSSSKKGSSYWAEGATVSPICNLDDGFPSRVARLKALGNAIVPQCSEYVGQCIAQSGLLCQ